MNRGISAVVASFVVVVDIVVGTAVDAAVDSCCCKQAVVAGFAPVAVDVAVNGETVAAIIAACLRFYLQ